MGRGRAKAKQTKVARDLKYRTHETDFGALANELHGQTNNDDTDELEGFDFDRAQQRESKIYDTTKAVFTLARQESVPPAVAADRLAEARMRDIGRLRGVWLP